MNPTRHAHTHWPLERRSSVQVVCFEGRAASLARFVGWDRFSKEMTMDPESCVVHGHTKMHNVPLGDVLYPLYFQTEATEERIPATGEMTEMQIRFLTKNETERSMTRIPDSWPTPRDPAFPFDGGLTDYLRPIGPGCYVGVGWKEPRLEFGDMGRRFLTFLMIKTVRKCNLSRS